jgi:flavin-dependent dehydrogenase
MLDAGAGGIPDLQTNLAACLALRGEVLADHELEGAPARWFDVDGVYALPHAVLAGDEAGLDPLFGEGIGFALAHGRVAAGAIARAFAVRDFSFADYRDRLLADRATGVLVDRARAARLFYGVRSPRLLRVMWRLGGPLLCLGMAIPARASGRAFGLDRTR